MIRKIALGAMAAAALALGTQLSGLAGIRDISKDPTQMAEAGKVPYEAQSAEELKTAASQGSAPEGTSEEGAKDQPAQEGASEEGIKEQPAPSESADPKESAADGSENIDVEAQSSEPDSPDSKDPGAQPSEPVTVQRVGLTADMPYAKASRINTGEAVLYTNNAGAHGDLVICVNAGHGTKGGAKVKTPSHPDGSPKVTGGTNAKGAVESYAVSAGMIFSDGASEAEVTLKEAVLLRDELLGRGYSVLMIREEADVQLDNVARTVLANQYADCHISIHWDSTSSDRGSFYIGVPDALKTMEPVASTWEKSEALGEALIAGLRGRGVKIWKNVSMDLDLTQTSYSSIPSVDMELGDKASDHGSEALAALARGLADGIGSYFGLDQ